MDCDAVEFVLCTISTNKNKLAQKVTSMNKVQYCPSSFTQDEYNDLYGDVIITEMYKEKITHKVKADEEKITHKVDEEKIAHKVKADEKINAHKIKADEEKITQKVKANNKGNMDGVMATKITNKNKENDQK